MAECLLQLRTDRMSGSIWSRSAAISSRQLAERFYTQTEYETIRTRPAAEHAFQFYRLWVAKEALLKAQGTGISASAMRDSYVRLFVTSECPAIRRFGDANGLDEWLICGQDWQGAVSAFGNDWSVRVLDA
jgi:4'-phosphopantetheinyl transferase